MVAMATDLQKPFQYILTSIENYCGCVCSISQILSVDNRSLYLLSCDPRCLSFITREPDFIFWYTCISFFWQIFSFTPQMFTLRPWPLHVTHWMQMTYYTVHVLVLESRQPIQGHFSPSRWNSLNEWLQWNLAHLLSNKHTRCF